MLLISGSGFSEVKTEIRDDNHRLQKSSNGCFELFLLTANGSNRSDGNSNRRPAAHSAGSGEQYLRSEHDNILPKTLAMKRPPPLDLRTAHGVWVDEVFRLHLRDELGFRGMLDQQCWWLIPGLASLVPMTKELDPVKVVLNECSPSFW